jgi:2-polyprenyl-3-methyl-5-hydroxy-6-metoxy-1,4-benzoquinol methylase
MNWDNAQKSELKYWGNCVNTYTEETKQLFYIKKMGITVDSNNWIDLQGKSILDIGGGPVSILLKAWNGSKTVVDPMDMEKWVQLRYELSGIKYIQQKAEEPIEGQFDEVWIYNVLQHCENPKKVIENAKKISKLIRIFEWVNIPTDDKHIQILKEEELDKWLGGYGKTEEINEFYCYQHSYYGVFI